jgi:tetratricopeptide (TPR) repeat protein
LNKITAIESVKLIRQLSNCDDAVEDIKKLAATLGELPLAIAQAAAYIRQQNKHTRYTVTTYLADYEKNRQALLRDDSLNHWLKTPHESVFVTWLMNIEVLRKKEPLAETLLQYCAYFDGKSIPLGLLKACLQQSQAGLTEMDIRKLFEAIQEYSLLMFDRENEAISVQQLVQEIVRGCMSMEERQEILLKAINAIEQESQEKNPTVEDMRRRTKLILHMELIKQYSEETFAYLDKKIQDTRLLPLLLCLAEVYRDLGDVHKKKALLERALSIQEAHYGKNHWHLAATLGSLANAHGSLGDTHQKKALLERALTIKEEHYGKNHWEITDILNNLGWAYNELGKPKEAKALLERALAIQEAHYDKDHKDYWQVAVTLTNLANAHGFLGHIHTEDIIRASVGH